MSPMDPVRKKFLDVTNYYGHAGADESTGDGAGIMFGLPHEFFRSRTAEIDTKPTVLPAPASSPLPCASCAATRPAGPTQSSGGSASWSPTPDTR